MAASINSNVLVIGGGPAGTSAAIICARSGLSVTLLEAQAFPRHRPGETLHPGVEPLLMRLGVSAGLEGANFVRHAGVWVEHFGPPEFQPYGGDQYGPWRGYQACRTEFDNLLLAHARSCGVRILQPHRALRALQEGDRITGAETTAGTVNASLNIDASGSFGWLARQRSLRYRRASRKLIAFYGYAQGECPVRDVAPCFTYQPDGWLWTARVRPKLYQWTRLFATYPPVRPEGPPPEFAGLEPVGRSKGVDVTWRQIESSAGPGYFVTGDAACVSDPSSSHGVLRAIMSGLLAGHLAMRQIVGNQPDSALAREYQSFIQSSFEFDWARSSKLYQLAHLNIENEQPNHPI